MKPKYILNINELDLKKQYTYSDYLTWRFNERVELIKGWIYKMSPATKRFHQEIEGVLHAKIWNFFENKPCKVYQSPFDVRLKRSRGKDDEIDTVVQPDICLVCDLEKLDEAGCLGAPDLIVEILSASTAKKDYNEKFNLYEENGVKEYWIADPANKSIEIFSLMNEKYESLGLYIENEGITEVEGNLFPDLRIPLKSIFGK
ncbi:Uma2 family endonuclease [Psychroflexus maritimus]|uniref:Uma2 family endonuclease n=1 Tax=Psychroflexus maritimus TaxID=2714865 RepID=A0A967DY54_9FLAO|nr:Uma2 family endonuclease [Psychroflexus maritimus]NGZ89450.1 Uma2 family endonuclease [Psychroflexus maritimus]